jgi:hypothetical protein
MKITNEFKNALKICGIPKWKIARKIGCHPTTFSRLLSGWQPLAHDDERLKEAARLIGFPGDRIFSDCRDQ